MITQSIQWAADAMGAEIISGNSQGTFSGVSTDTRELKPQSLFFCLMGERDGHGFAAQAAQKGCQGIVIDRGHISLREELPPSTAILVVSDTLRALGDLAHAWRISFQIPVVAITGSNGKTSTKDMIRALLETQMKVHATEGNFNNLIGVPKTLFGLHSGHQAAVIEMGMNDFGEIARLSEISQPTLGLITNVGPAHLEKLKDLKGVAQAKGELFAALDPEAMALVNGLDPLVCEIPTRAKRVVLGKRDSGLWGEVEKEDTQGTFPLSLKIHLPEGPMSFKLRIPGAHQLENVLLALGVAHHLGISWEQARHTLENFQGTPSRMETLALKGGRHLLNDAYNANPASTGAALQTLRQLKGPQVGMAILGQMNELGQYAAAGHQEVGREVGELGLEYLVAIGDYREETLKGAKQAGMEKGQLQGFPNVEMAMKTLAWIPPEVNWILIKGSRTNHLEKLVLAIKEGL